MTHFLFVESYEQVNFFLSQGHYTLRFVNLELIVHLRVLSFFDSFVTFSIRFWMIPLLFDLECLLYFVASQKCPISVAVRLHVIDPILGAVIRCSLSPSMEEP